MASTPEPPGEDGAGDGRRRRGESNRARIVQAMLDLVRAGDYAPSAERVAGRAEVSLRTVFRHFEDMETLFAEMIRPVETELRTMAAEPFVAQDWRGRIVEMAARRSAGFEAMAVFKWAADARRHDSPILAESAARLNGLLRQILLQHLPPDRRDGELIELLDLALSFETWSRLRREQALSPEAVRETMQALVERVLPAN